MQWDLLMDVEALGNELRFPENGMCISSKMALEDKGKLSRLQLADHKKDGRMPGYLEAMIEVKKISNHARRTWYDEAPSKGAKNHWDPFYRANPINCGFIEICTFIRVLHFQFLLKIYCFEKSIFKHMHFITHI